MKDVELGYLLSPLLTILFFSILLVIFKIYIKNMFNQEHYLLYQ